MTPTISKVFLDSSFFTEGYKGTNRDFYQFFSTNAGMHCYNNSVVCSEHWYTLTGLIGKVSPLTLKERKCIRATVAQDAERIKFFRDFIVLPVEADEIELALKLMQMHDLLSNDSLIQASCIHFGITYIVSHDSDFENACLSEGIRLKTPLNYKQFFS